MSLWSTVDMSMSDREHTRWEHNRIYPHPISPCLCTYGKRLYCCETVDAHCYRNKYREGGDCLDIEDWGWVV